jgi:DNA-directed RNA polymerase II subunit RPB7
MIVKRLWTNFFKTRDKINNLKKKIDTSMAQPFDIVCAFVTFEQETDKVTCQDEYRPYFTRFRSERTKFRPGANTSYLKVKQSVEASDILWENMTNVGWKQYVLRRSLTAIVITLLLAGNIVLVVFATAQSKSSGAYLVNCEDLFASNNINANSTMACKAVWDMSADSLATESAVLSNKNYRAQVNGAECGNFIQSATWTFDMNQFAPYSDLDAYSSLTVEEAALQGYDSDGAWLGGMDSFTRGDECAAKICYDCMCKTAVAAGKVTTICNEYYKDQLRIYGFEAGRLTIVALNSMILLWASAKFALFERHRTISATEQVTSRFAFFTLVTNALVLPLLVNVRIHGLNSFPLLFRGSYDDTTIDWYAAVMRSLMISALINAVWFGPSRVVQTWISHIVRYASSNFAMTQYALSEMYKRPRFTLAERYGQSMTVILTAIVLFSAAPILIPAACVYCILAYWSDKTLLLRYSRYPSNYDHLLARQFLDFVPLACLMHFIFAAWVFTQWDVPTYFIPGMNGFDAELVDQRRNDFWTVRANIEKYDQMDFEQRFHRANGLIQVIPLIAYFFYLMVKTVAVKVGKSALAFFDATADRRWKAEIQFTNFSFARSKSIENEHDDETLYGLHSYRVQDNPEYAALFPEALTLEGERDTFNRD